MAAANIVELSSLTHRYADRVALRDLTMDVSAGTILAILGPNGGGKTTLFRILATLLTPTAGTARIAGHDVVTAQGAVRAAIGVVFQYPSLDEKLSVLENMHHQGHLYGLSGAALRTRSRELLQRFGVDARSGDTVEKLSGGLKRRVELAKAMLHRPSVLLLDEPSTGLDPAVKLALFQQLVELKEREGVTTLLTTHLMDEADRCDRIAIVDQGKLVALDSAAALKQVIGGDVLTITTADPHALRPRIEARFGGAITLVDGGLRVERECGAAFVPTLIEAFPGEIESVTVGKPTLDDVFLHLTGHRFEERRGGETDAQPAG
ncbi:MAG: ATP-binding cassette domain-containing protein [Planctomycetes bacterium]|nr:ATP-binding cassette domain-containing protein [Planctomycetota bacterium]